MAQHHDRVSAGHDIILGRQYASHRGAHAQRLKVISRNELARAEIGLAVVGNACGK